MRHNITYTKYSINGKMNTILCCCTPLGVHELKLHCCHFGKWFSLVALHSECMN